MDELKQKCIVLEQAILKKAKSDPAFRSALIENPAEAVERFWGKAIPEGMYLRVYQDSGDRLFVSLPFKRRK